MNILYEKMPSKKGPQNVKTQCSKKNGCLAYMMLSGGGKRKTYQTSKRRQDIELLDSVAKEGS